MSNALASLEAERAVIAACLLADDTRVTAALYVADPQDYTDGRHALAVGCLRALADRSIPIDTSALCLEIERRGHAVTADWREWLCTVTETIPNFALAVTAAERVKELAAARTRRAEHVVIAALYAEGRIEEAEQRAHELARMGTAAVTRSRRISFAEAAMGPFQRLMAAADGRPPADGRRRVPTGIAALDRTLRGLRSRSMLVIGARPSVGKSTLMLQMALGQARAGERPGYVSVEDDEEVAGERALAGVSGVPLRWVGDADAAKLTREQWASLVEAMQQIQDAGGALSVPYSPRVEVVCAEMRWLVRERGATCLFVDYLQKLRAKGQGKLEQVSNAAAAIEEEAEALDVPLVTASQLSRPDRGDEWDEPPLERLRYTGDIEASADAVVMAWYDRAPSIDDEAELIDPRPVNLRVAKLKWGSPGALIQMRRAPSGELYEIDDAYAEAAQ